MNRRQSLVLGVILAWSLFVYFLVVALGCSPALPYFDTSRPGYGGEVVEGRTVDLAQAELDGLPAWWWEDHPPVEVRGRSTKIPGAGVPGVPPGFHRLWCPEGPGSIGSPPPSFDAGRRCPPKWLGYGAELFQIVTVPTTAECCRRNKWGTAATHTCSPPGAVADWSDANWNAVMLPRSHPFYGECWWELKRGGTPSRPIVFANEEDVRRSGAFISGAKAAKAWRLGPVVYESRAFPGRYYHLRNELPCGHPVNTGLPGCAAEPPPPAGPPPAPTPGPEPPPDPGPPCPDCPDCPEPEPCAEPYPAIDPATAVVDLYCETRWLPTRTGREQTGRLVVVGERADGEVRTIRFRTGRVTLPGGEGLELCREGRR